MKGPLDHKADLNPSRSQGQGFLHGQRPDPELTLVKLDRSLESEIISNVEFIFPHALDNMAYTIGRKRLKPSYNWVKIDIHNS